MLDAFKAFVTRHDLCSPSDRIIVAVSGGLDSMVLLDLFLQAGHSPAVAHCNFALRGKESDGDEEFVAGYCKRHQLTFFTRRFETKNYAEEHGTSVQMAARNLRYEWFDQLQRENNYHWIATAHHLDDNMETVLLRWAKGADLSSLLGIPRKNDRVIRPMLFATRAQIRKYASGRRLKWREDSSNESDDYSRNFIRHHVVPQLREINPSIESTFETSIEKIRGGHELMQRGLAQLRDAATKTEEDKFMIDKSILLLLETPAFACYEWLRPYGFDWARCNQLVEAAQGQPGKTFLSSTHQAVNDREYIIVQPRSVRFSDILIEEGQDKVALGPWMLTLKSIQGGKVRKEVDVASIDRSKIKYPMVWRRWKAGDSFYPTGLGHRKKISDFLIDRKIPLQDKDLVTVLESGNEVVWVVGHRMDERFKVTAKTKGVLEVQLSRI